MSQTRVNKKRWLIPAYESFAFTDSDYQALHFACKRRCLSIAEKLISHGADLAAVDKVSHSKFKFSVPFLTDAIQKGKVPFEYLNEADRASLEVSVRVRGCSPWL
jgi:ankyrin repeat protein